MKLERKNPYDRYTPVINGVLDGQGYLREVLAHEFEPRDVVIAFENAPEVLMAVAYQMISHGWNSWASRMMKIYCERMEGRS